MPRPDLTQKTSDHYDTLLDVVGENYIRERWHSGPVQRSHYRQTRRAIRRFFAGLGRVDNALEIGCGPGTWTDICLEHANRLLLVDLAEKMLSLARQRFAAHPAVRFQQGDYLTLDLSAHQPFDLIFSARALEYMSDKEAFVRKSVGNLADGGVLAVITKNPKWGDKVKASRAHGAEDPGTSPNDIQSDWVYWRDLEEFCRANGLSEVRSYPAAFGSYHRPYAWRIGAVATDAWHRIRGDRPMTENLDALTESYLTVARK